MVGDLIDFPPSFLSCWNDEGLTAIMFFDRLGHEYRSLIERNAQNDFSILSQGSCCISEYINFITSCHHPKKKTTKKQSDNPMKRFNTADWSKLLHIYKYIWKHLWWTTA